MIECSQDVVVKPIDIVRVHIVNLQQVNLHPSSSKTYQLRSSGVESRFTYQYNGIEGVFFEELLGGYLDIRLYKEIIKYIDKLYGFFVACRSHRIRPIDIPFKEAV
jgi:hypothetical protein